jgi:hypothetical protein
MATTNQLYNHTVNCFNTGANAVTDTYRVMLLNDSATFIATHTQLTQVSNADAYEVSGNGWAAGGFTLTGISIAVADTNGGKFDANDVSQAISGGDLGPYYKYVVYNDTKEDSPPVCFITMDSPLTVTSGNTAGITWNADGIIKWTVA